jgi:hypothetical protein
MKAITLIDITETNQTRNRSTDKLACSQQANWMTFVQTLMLRTNVLCNTPTVSEYSAAELKKLGFGSDYKTKQKVWEVSISTEEYHTLPEVKDLEDDFNMVPVISDLNESIVINNNVFRTTPKAKNIIFQADDTTD